MIRIGLISALNCEIPSIIPYQRSKQVQTHYIGNKEVGVIVSGMGQRAEHATKRLCTEFEPDYLIHLGLCGGVDLDIGSLVIGNTVSHYGKDQECRESEELRNIKTALSNASIDHRVGCFQTFDHPVLSREGVLKGVRAVDMESYWVVKTAKDYSVPVIVIKSVSDVLLEVKPAVLPNVRLVGRVLINFRAAKNSLNDFAKSYFMG